MTGRLVRPRCIFVPVLPLLAVLVLATAGCDLGAPQATPPLTPRTSSSSPTAQSRAPTQARPTAATTASVPVNQLHTGDLPDGGGSVQVTAISCWAPGECVAGGGYSPAAHLYTHSFLATRSGGHWHNAFTVPGLDDSLDGSGNAVPESSVTWIVCRTSGSCRAGGTYTDDLNAICLSCHTNAFVVDQVRGEWYCAIPVPGLGSLNRGDTASTRRR